MNANDSNQAGKSTPGDDEKREAAPIAPGDPVKHDDNPGDNPAVEKPAAAPEPVKAGPPASDR